VNVNLSYLTVHRIPNPKGRGVTLSAEASGLGTLALTTIQDAGALGTSLAQGGAWANLDVTSLATSGVLARLGLVDRIQNGVLFTAYGPLTKGDGSGELAEVSHVNVTLDGVSAVPIAIDPVAGVLILDQAIAASVEVKVTYSYVPQPTLEFGGLNNPNFVLNQVVGSQVHPFSFTSVLGPFSAKDQALEVEHRWTAFDYEYTAILNDPTSMVLNEQVNRSAMQPFRREIRPTSVFFEGDGHPVDFEYTGDALGAPVLSADQLYQIVDTSTGVDNLAGSPALFKRSLDLSYETQSILNWRMRVQSYVLQGVFTGLAVGYADTEKAFLTGFLELSGAFLTLGILADLGDETLASSWKGREAEVELVSGSPIALRTLASIPVVVGSRLWVDGQIVTVTAIADEGASGILITVDQALIATGTVNAFVEVDFTSLRAYQARVREGVYEVTLAGSSVPLALVAREEAAVAPEIFALIDQSTLFFGSVSRRGESVSFWDFVRYSILPTQSIEQDSEVNVNTNMTVLPEEDDTPWQVTSNQGYAKTLAGDLVLAQSAGEPVAGFGYGWTRIEPFLDYQTFTEIRFRMRVTSWGTGIASHVICDNTDRSITLGFFDDDAVQTFVSPQTLSKLNSGFWQVPNAQSLMTRGHLESFNAPLPPDVFLVGYGGVQEPVEVGITSTFPASELSYIDHSLVLTHASGAAQLQGVATGKGGFTNWVYGAKWTLSDYTLNASGCVPVQFGVSDGDKALYVSLQEDAGVRYITMVSASGDPVLDGGVPLRLNYDWQEDVPTALRMARFDDNLTVFVDGVYVGLLDALLAPSSSVVDLETVVSATGQVTFTLDYFYTHQARHKARHLGLLRGANRLDATQYEQVPAEFLGTFIDVRVRIDPLTTVDVFVNGAGTASISIPYNELPKSQELAGVNTEFGWVHFGTTDPQAYTESQWDLVSYTLVHQREDQRPLRTAVLNYANVLTSPEPTIDQTPECVLIEPYTLNTIRVGRIGMYAERVVSVTDSEGVVAYAYTFDPDTNTITLAQDLADLTSPLKVTFYSTSAYTKAYLQNNEAGIRLLEGTPPFALSHQAGFTLISDPDTPLSDVRDRFTQDDNDYVMYGGGAEYIFARTPDAFLSDLDLCSDPVVGGISGKLTLACDAGGFTDIAFDDPFATDSYVQPSEPVSTHRGRLLHLNRSTSTLNSPEGILACPQSPVTLTCEWSLSETYAGALDQALPSVSVLSDWYGSGTLNNPKATLNSEVTDGDTVHPTSVLFRTNTYTASDTPLDFLTPVNVP
jgi:hypothetical protein